MRLLILSDGWTFLLCVLLWPVFQTASALLSARLPDPLFSAPRGLFRTFGWERGGQIYQVVFRVKRWKRYLPDGAALMGRGFRKRRLSSFSQQNLERFLNESRRAELSHWLAILPFWSFGFIAPPRVIPYMLAYALAVNLPCILAQRYNRPRIELLEGRRAARQRSKAIQNKAV